MEGPGGSRRALLLGLAALSASTAGPAWAGGLCKEPLNIIRSIRSDRASLLRVTNGTASTLKAYWINFDGDAEIFTTLSPGGTWMVDTFETHPWRFVDAETGAVVAEYTAMRGAHSLEVASDVAFTSAPMTTHSSTTSNGIDPSCTGFDGIGNSEQDYLEAQFTTMAVDQAGGQALLSFDQSPVTLSIYIGLMEAANVAYAAGMETRRPSTIGTWGASLMATGSKVERVLITRLVGNTYYARIVLAMPDGRTNASVDARPSDSLALALQVNAPIFVSKTIVAEEEENQTLRAMQMLEDMLSGGGRLQPNAPPLEDDGLSALMELADPDETTEA